MGKEMLGRKEGWDGRAVKGLHTNQAASSPYI